MSSRGKETIPLKIVQISAQELDHRKQVENGVVGIPRKCLEAKTRILAGRGE